MKELYLRRLKLWIPDSVKQRAESRSNLALVRSSTMIGLEPLLCVQTLYPVSSATALLLDIELSEYIIDR